MGGPVEVDAADDLGDVGDGVLGQQHRAEHALLGGVVLRRGAVAGPGRAARPARRPPGRRPSPRSGGSGKPRWSCSAMLTRPPGLIGESGCDGCDGSDGRTNHRHGHRHGRRPRRAVDRTSLRGRGPRKDVIHRLRPAWGQPAAAVEDPPRRLCTDLGEALCRTRPGRRVDRPLTCGNVRPAGVHAKYFGERSFIFSPSGIRLSGKSTISRSDDANSRFPPLVHRRPAGRRRARPVADPRLPLRGPPARTIAGSRDLAAGPARRSWRWSPSRCSCSPTRPSSATSAPPRWPASASPRPCSRPSSGCASSSPTAPPRASPACSAPATARAALAQGIDGVWLAVVIGRRSSPLVGVATTGPLVGLFGAGPEVADPATTYLRIAFLGVTPAAGHARDDRHPARPAGHPDPARRRRGRQRRSTSCSTWCSSTASGGFDGLGIAGSALGSVLAQVASAAALLAVVVRGARARGRQPAARPARHPARGPGQRGAGHPHADPARGAAAHDVRRRARRRQHVRRRPVRVRRHPPAGVHDLELPGVRARRHRDRRPGHHRPVPRRRRPRRAPGP